MAAPNASADFFIKVIDIQSAVRAVLARTDRAIFDEIVHVATTPGAVFAQSSRAPAFLVERPVLGQIMYDSATRRLRTESAELIIACIEKDDSGKLVLVAPDNVGYLQPNEEMCEPVQSAPLLA